MKIFINFVGMKRLRGIVACMMLGILIFLTGCSANEWEVEFDLPASLTSNYRIVYYASSPKEGFMVETAAAVNAGKCQMKCPAKNPCVVFLFTPGAISPSAIFWAEKGDKIKISGNNPDPATWEIEGNKLTKQITHWRLENLDALRSVDPMQINTAVAKTVKANPDSRLSALLLLTYYFRLDDEKGFNTLWASLGKDAHKDEIAAATGRIDIQLFDYSSAKERLSRLILPRLKEKADTLPGRKDTLQFSRSEGSILYFWIPLSNDRSEAIDTLKVLRRNYPDSKKRIIADICMEADSAVWANTARRDSAINVSRLWMPQGTAHPEALRLGVPRPGYFIVADKKGNQVYRGDDIKAAARAFRKIKNN